VSSWVNRTVLSGASISQNGTTSHTCTFTPATAGNALLAVLGAGTQFTTPTGWTLFSGGVQGGSMLVVFTKTASAAESSFTTTHNGSNPPILGLVYEFLAGTTFGVATAVVAQTINFPVTGPQLTSLTGTYTGFSVRTTNMGPHSNYLSTCAWTTPPTVDYDGYNQIVSSPGDTCGLTIAYADGLTGSTFNPDANYASPGSAAAGVTFTVLPVADFSISGPTATLVVTAPTGSVDAGGGNVGDVQLSLVGHVRRVRGG
jgi:hypothetical protein